MSTPPTTQVPPPGPLTATPRPNALERPALWWLDIVVAVLMTLFSGLVAGGLGGSSTWSWGAEVLLWAAVAVRTRFPAIALGVATAGGLAMFIFSDVPAFSLVALPLVVYSVARWGRPRTGWVMVAIGVLASLAGPARWFVLGANYSRTSSAALFVTFTIACGLILLTPYLIGRARRAGQVSRTERLAADRERERHRMIEREQQLRMDAVHERNRIARELHDIVAHSLSVIVVQADGGKALAAKRPEVAAEVLGTIADTSRRSLAEMRSMVRLLRGDAEEPGSYVPTPGLADIDDLVQRTGNATVEVHGPPPVVSEAVGLTAYRVIQESLTNVLKHGGPGARAQVIIDHHPGLIMIEVTDNGRGAAAGDDHQGNGLTGMRERVELHGGRLDARPAVGGGFRVRAELPLSPQPTGPTPYGVR